MNIEQLRMKIARKTASELIAWWPNGSRGEHVKELVESLGLFDARGVSEVLGAIEEQTGLELSEADCALIENEDAGRDWL